MYHPPTLSWRATTVLSDDDPLRLCKEVLDMVGTVPAVEFYKLENVRFLSFLYLYDNGVLG